MQVQHLGGGHLELLHGDAVILEQPLGLVLQQVQAGHRRGLEGPGQTGFQFPVPVRHLAPRAGAALRSLGAARRAGRARDILPVPFPVSGSNGGYDKFRYWARGG